MFASKGVDHSAGFRGDLPLLPLLQRECLQCHDLWPLSDFTKATSNPSGKKLTCSLCNSKATSLRYSKDLTKSVLKSLQTALTGLHKKDPHTYPVEMGKDLRGAALRLSVLPCHYCTAERGAGDLPGSLVTCMNVSTDYLLLLIISSWITSSDITCAHADSQGYWLDRVIPNEPYQNVENLVSCCGDCNRWKGTTKSYKQTRARFHAERIVKHLGIDPTSQDLCNV